MATVDFNSPYYPYEKVQTGYLTFNGAEKLPLKVLKYLMDLPDEHGYEPVDDNSRPRVRLMKYLYYDGANPLSKPLPTAEEKLSILFDPNEPSVNTEEQKKKHPNGYRMFAQEYWEPSELEAKTIIKCYTGRVIPYSGHRCSIGLEFEIIANYGNDTNTRTDAYSRIYAMECAIIGALNGVNIGGIGVCQFNKIAHADAGSRPYRDQGQHIYRYLNLSMEWAESQPDEQNYIRND